MADAESSPVELQQQFQTALNNASTRGRAPGRDTGLGPHTLAAMTLVAHDHPDATANLIANTYDTFNREHC